MNNPLCDACLQTRDLINLIDATIVEIVLYARGETQMYADDSELKARLQIQATALDKAIDQLNNTLISNEKDFAAVRPPENVPGQVLAIAEVVVKRLYHFSSSDQQTFVQFFRMLPMAPRQELMGRLRAYRDFVFRAANIERTEADDSGFSTDPPAPYWW